MAAQGLVVAENVPDGAADQEPRRERSALPRQVVADTRAAEEQLARGSLTFFFCFASREISQLPFHLRWLLNGGPSSFANLCSFILDTTTVKTYKPEMKHGDFNRYAFHFWNHHKRTFGVKLELAVATQRIPVPIGISVVPAGWSDITIARLPQGVFSRMAPGERALGDPGYAGERSKIYAPPKKNMLSYVEELDKAELTLQRRVEMANEHLKEFKSLGTTYRKGALRAFRDIEIIAIVVAKLIVLDIFLNQDHCGSIHVSGPAPPPAPTHIQMRKPRRVLGIGKPKLARRQINIIRRVLKREVHVVLRTRARRR